MKKSEWFLILFPLFFVWVLDHYTKIWASSIIKVHNFGYLHFVLSHNHGALLGLFSELPALLRIVSLSTVGTFLVFSYAAIQYIMPIKSMKLRIGMSLLVGGIVGNVTDRILWGYVVDFIVIGKGNWITPPFNLADVIQWIGYFMICAAVIRDGELLWPEQNNRKKIWINPTYQYRYITLLIIIGLSLTLIGGVFSYTYLRVTITELIGKNNYISSRFLIPFLGTYITICLIFCFALILMGRILSHRTAGPVYAFQKYLEDLLAGRSRKFKLRNGDDFKQLEPLAKKISLYFAERKTSAPSEAEPEAVSELALESDSQTNLPEQPPQQQASAVNDERPTEIGPPPMNIQETEDQSQNDHPQSAKLLKFPIIRTEYLNRGNTVVKITSAVDAYEHQEEG
jgi:signal peptidase II